MEPILYKGYTIEEDYFINPYSKDPSYMFYPTEQGAQHDADGDSEGFRYCGNCKWTDSIEDAKDQISEIVMMAAPLHKVLVDHGQRAYTITKFEWFEDAVKFAVRWKGQLMQPVQSI
jgi:hypothetical protein